MSSVEIDQFLRAKALMDQIGLEKWHFRKFQFSPIFRGFQAITLDMCSFKIVWLLLTL